MKNTELALAGKHIAPSKVVLDAGQVTDSQCAGPAGSLQDARSDTIVIGGISDIGDSPTTPTSVSTEDELLRSMQAHRKNHAAEMGQLRPRAQRTSGDSTSRTALTESQGSHDSHGWRTVSWPTSTADFRQMRTSLNPKAVPFRAFVQQHPPPSRTPRTPPSAWSARTQELMTEKLEAMTKPYPPIQENRSPVDEMLSYANSSSRGVNHGFEVPPAGTLTHPVPIQDFGFQPAPAKGEDDPPRARRKLRKRNRSGSQESEVSQSSKSSKSSQTKAEPGTSAKVKATRSELEPQIVSAAGLSRNFWSLLRGPRMAILG